MLFLSKNNSEDRPVYFVYNSTLIFLCFTVYNRIQLKHKQTDENSTD